MSPLVRLALVALVASAASPARAAGSPVLDVDVTAETTLMRGVPSALSLQTFHAWSLTRREPVAADVRVTLVPADGAGAGPEVLFEGHCEAGRPLALRLSGPEAPPGRGHLLIAARTAAAEAQVRVPVTVTEAALLHVTTDRPVYRGGQTLRWRVAAVGAVDARPLAGEEVTLQVTDPRGTRVWQGTATTDGTGFAAGELPLSDDLLLGAYRLDARLGEARDVAEVQVRAFELPPFTVALEGDSGGGRVTARYPYGEPVQGLVRVLAEVEGERGEALPIQGMLDVHGRFDFSLPRRARARGTLRIAATVTDGAGRTQVALREVRLGRRGLNVALLPERDPVQPGVGQRVTVVATDDDGRLVPAELTLRVDGRVVRRERAADGVMVAEVALPAPKARRPETWVALQGVEARFTAGTPDLEAFQKAAERALDGARDCMGDLGRVDDDVAARLLLAVERGRLRLLRAVRALGPDADVSVERGPEERACFERALRRVTLSDASATGRLVLFVDVGEYLDGEEGPRTVTFTATAKAPGEDLAEAALAVEVGDGPDRRVRVASPVVAAGQPVEVEVAWTPGAGPLTVTLLKADVALDATTMTVGPDGRARATLRAPEGAFGLAGVRVSEATPAAGVEVDAEDVAVYLTPRALDVQVEAATRHRPGDEVAVRVRVADQAGRAAAGVGLAAAVVDERVLGLGPRRVPLAEALRFGGLEAAEAAGLAFRAFLPEAERAGARALLAGLLQVVPGTERLPFVAAPAQARWAAVAAQVAGLAHALVTGLETHPGPIVRRGADGWEPAVAVDEALARAGVGADQRRGPMGDALAWEEVEAVDERLTAPALAVSVSWGRLERLGAELEARLAQETLDRAALARQGLQAVTALDPALRVDAWGGAVALEATPRGELALRAPGPDGRPGTADDLVLPGVTTEATGFEWTMSSHGVGGMVAGGMHAVGAEAIGRYGRAERRATTAPVRERFDETVLWSVGTRTDAGGRATLRVPLADSITGWEVAVEALSAGGAVGHGAGRLETFLPLAVDAGLPDQLTVGDRFVAQAVVANHSGVTRRLTVEATADGAVRLDGPRLTHVEVPDGATAALPLSLSAEGAGEGRVTLRLSDEGGEVDALRRRLTVTPPGRPERLAVAGTLRAGTPLALPFTLPATLARESFSGRVRVFRDAADQALDGLEDLLREPHGCFEQTSTANYPNLLVLRLLEGRPGREAARARARALVTKGYQKLLTFEVPGGGFSWFGDAPANRVLTAYGLVQFADMARVIPVDPALIARTRDWLVALQRPDGSWEPDPRWLHDWSAQQGALATTAWIAWALSQAAPEDPALARALAFLQRNEAAVDAPYVAALWAAAARRAGQEAPAALRLLAANVQRDGDARFVSAAQPTLLYGRGRAADVEVTALAATLGAPLPQDALLEWLWRARDPRGGWRTTQATIQSLRALADAAAAAPPVDEGWVELSLDGTALAALDLSRDEVPTRELPEGLGPGEHALRVTTTEPGRFRVELRAQWRGATQAEAVDAGLSVRLTAESDAVRVGEHLPMRVVLSHRGSAVLPMPTVVVPVPPGFRPDPRALKALVDAGNIARFEDHGRELQLYMKELAPGATVTLAYALEATAECEVTQHGARAFAYYDPTTHGYSENLRLRALSRQ